MSRNRFESALRLMSVTVRMEDSLVLLCKGARESVLDRCTTIAGATGDLGLTKAGLVDLETAAEEMERQGYRVLALADRTGVPSDPSVPRADLESELRLVGLVALTDPPRADVLAAVRRCHEAGVRVHVITGDGPLTASAVAEDVGVVASRVISGEELREMDEEDLVEAVSHGEAVFARASPQDKLRIAGAVRAAGHVFAMTGDGVNDAPALRFADIGIAMGRSGTDVAREAASLILTDDSFATIVRAIESGRQVYSNIRKFIVYVFAHAVPEVVPFLMFALSGGAIPLGITGMQILAIDVGTETLPALALGREKAEPGIMARPPRPRDEKLITGTMLLRSWGVLGLTSAFLTSSAFLFHLWQDGWSWGADTGPGSELRTTYLEATTITFLGIVLCQIGTAFAARTEKASLKQIGVFSNRPLLWGIAFELAVAAVVIYLPVMQPLFNTSALSLVDVVPLLSFPVIVWGADELWRRRRRRIEAAWTPDGQQATLATTQGAA